MLGNARKREYWRITAGTKSGPMRQFGSSACMQTKSFTKAPVVFFGVTYIEISPGDAGVSLLKSRLGRPSVFVEITRGGSRCLLF